VLEFFKMVKRGIIPQLEGKEKYTSLIFVKDLVEGMVLAAEHKKSKSHTYFLTDPAPYSYDEFGRIILDILGKRGIRVTIPRSIMTGIAGISEGLALLTKRKALLNRQKILEMTQDFWVCSPGKAKKELGFECSHALADGAAETIRWYVQHNWL